MRRPLPRPVDHWAGPGGPARTRSVVHQGAPVIRTRAGARVAGHGKRSRRLMLAVIASFLCRSRSCPSPEKEAAAPGQTMSDLKGTVTFLVRAVFAAVSFLFVPPKIGWAGLGGSAASLPVRGFM